MFERVKRSFQLIKESFRILLLDKELLLFPLISGIFLFLIFLTYILPLIGTIFKGQEESGFFIGALGYVWLFMFYVLSYFIGIFFEVALISCVAIRLKGKDPSFMDGIRAAFRNVHKVLAWAIVASTVGLILRNIQERYNLLGKIAVAIVGMAWALATFFVIPIMIFENIGVFASIKRSAQLFKQTWGESVIGQFSIGLFFGFLFMFVAIGLIGLVALLAVVGAGLVIIPLLMIFGLAIITIILVSSTISGIYLTALYTYATSKKVPAGFSKEFIVDAYKKKI